MSRSSKHQDLSHSVRVTAKCRTRRPVILLGWRADLRAANQRELAPSSRGLPRSHQWYSLSGGVPNLVDHSQPWVTAQVARFVSIGKFRVGVVGSFGVLLPATPCLSPVTFRAGIAKGRWSLLWAESKYSLSDSYW
jgi:hypothetical protein